MPFPRWHQASIARWLVARMNRDGIQTVFMTRFKPLNHCLVAYHYTKLPNGDIVFDVCDVNQPGKKVHLTYRVATRSFYYDRSWYYPGGVVNILKLYISALNWPKINLLTISLKFELTRALLHEILKPLQGNNLLQCDMHGFGSGFYSKKRYCFLRQFYVKPDRCKNFRHIAESCRWPLKDCFHRACTITL